MALYREHKGLLATIITVISLEGVEAHYKDDPYFHKLTEYQCEYYDHDDRMSEWASTYMVTAMLDGQRIVTGFANAQLK